MIATPPVPMPDSAVGRHESVRPGKQPYWVTGLKLKGRDGRWDCLVFPGRTHMVCVPERVA
jgi:hypothetical protein